jgi:broad specificity phosphatase PhoE
MMVIKGIGYRVWAVVLFALVACETGSYSDDFVLAYAELRIAERDYGETENGKAMRLQILQRHKLSAEDFEERMEKIKKEPQKWQEFQNRLVKILDSIANSLKGEEGS